MTTTVLRASTRLNLRSIKVEIEAAHEEGLLTDREAQTILFAHSILSNLLEQVCEVERARAPGSPLSERRPLDSQVTQVISEAQWWHVTERELERLVAIVVFQTWMDPEKARAYLRAMHS